MRARTYTKAYHDFIGPFGVQRLSTPAQSMLLCLFCQYDGHNNGSLMITPRVMPARWKSNDTRSKARSDLLDARFVFETRRGRRPNIASLYALACFPLDPNPNHDPELVAQFDMDAWRSTPPDVTGPTPPGVTTTNDEGMSAYTAGRPNADFATPPDVTADAPIAPPGAHETRKRYTAGRQRIKTSTRLSGGEPVGGAR